MAEEKSSLEIIGQLPFTSDKIEDLYEQIFNQFESLNNDMSPVIKKLAELTSDDRYSQNS